MIQPNVAPVLQSQFTAANQMWRVANAVSDDDELSQTWTLFHRLSLVNTHTLNM